MIDRDPLEELARIKQEQAELNLIRGDLARRVHPLTSQFWETAFQAPYQLPINQGVAKVDLVGEEGSYLVLTQRFLTPTGRIFEKIVHWFGERRDRILMDEILGELDLAEYRKCLPFASEKIDLFVKKSQEHPRGYGIEYLPRTARQLP